MVFWHIYLECAQVGQENGEVGFKIHVECLGSQIPFPPPHAYPNHMPIPKLKRAMAGGGVNERISTLRVTSCGIEQSSIRRSYLKV